MSELALNPVSKTAYYCCGLRAADAACEKPICGDTFARLFMNAEAESVFARFKRFEHANAQNVARFRIIDDILRERLRSSPDLLIVLLGAGFDTRAFRLAGGRWVELDEPALIAAKEAALPASRAKNSLERVPISFATESLADKLAPWAGERGVVVVLEGVATYLTRKELRSTLDALHRALPGHVLICDLMRAGMVRGYGGPMRREFESLGARYGEFMRRPEPFFAAAGYRLVERVRVLDRACELGAMRIPYLLRATLLRGLREGFVICQFAAEA